MEKLSCTEDVRLGYRSKRFLGIRTASSLSSPIMRSRNFDPGGNRRPDAESDFADVFGGPPRLAAAKEVSSPKPVERYGNLREKPVFGEESTRRRVSRDFFDDIYGGECLSTARRQPEKRVAFYSMPGSRMLSPTCASPPKTVPLSPVPSLPSRRGHFSDLGKGADNQTSVTPTCGSPNICKLSSSEGVPPSPILSVSSPKIQPHGHAHSNRFSVHSVQGQQNPIIDVRSSYQRSRLSHQYSFMDNELPKLTGSSGRKSEGDIRAKVSQAGHTSKSLQNSNQFHFSIHKWAGKGAALFMPLRRWDGSGQQNTRESKTSGHKPVFEEVAARDVGKAFVASASDHGRLGVAVTPSHDPDPNRKEYQQQNEKILSDGDHRNASEHNLPESFENIGPNLKEASEFQAKNIPSLLKDDLEGSGMDKISVQHAGMGQYETKSRSIYDGQNIKQAATGYTNDKAEATTSLVDTVEANPEGRLHGNRVKSKVKEFIKIFSQEASQRSTARTDSRAEKSGGKGKQPSNVEVKPNASHMDTKLEKNVNGSGDTASSHTLLKIHHILEQEEDSDFDLPFVQPDIHSSSSIRDEFTAQETSEVANDLKGRSPGDNLPVPGNCFVEPTFNDQKHEILIAGPQEEIQCLDAKIRNWADGKEGNIRSLLSTLQYILWSGSGWKPVALVDIIEGTAVKRTYQKALLCLHPDKLQQKDATVHQKYIAEKVFDIVQEAWTHFNDVSSL
ncbi:unnamed protein product [Victoria cruziana]